MTTAPAEVDRLRWIVTLAKNRKTALGEAKAKQLLMLAQGSKFDNDVAKEVIVELLRMTPDSTATPQPSPQTPFLVAEAPRKGSNKFQNRCLLCGGVINTEAGFYFGVQGCYFNVHKVGQCQTVTAPLPPARTQKFASGNVYKLSDGRLAKTILSGTGNVYAKVLTKGGKWEYDSKALRDHPEGSCTILDKASVANESCIYRFGYPLGSEELRQYAAGHGHSTGQCVFCMLPLTDDGEGKSVQVGYGQKCAKNYGLPWGKTAVANDATTKVYQAKAAKAERHPHMLSDEEARAYQDKYGKAWNE